MELWEDWGRWNDWSAWATMGQWRSWRRRMEDPIREELLAEEPPDLEKMLAFMPRPMMQPGIDPGIIKSNIERLETEPQVNLGHPLLDLSVKTGLAHIDATFQGDHPKYGTGFYAQSLVDPWA